VRRRPSTASRRRAVRALPALPHRAGAWIRPLLDVTRAEVRTELMARGVAWREDASNADRGPARNRIRHEVLPVLRGLNPAAEVNLARAAALAADERELLDGLAAGLVDDDGTIDLARLRGAHPALQRLALQQAAARAGVRLGHADVEALRAMAVVGAERRTLPGAAMAERRRARLRFIAATPGRATA